MKVGELRHLISHMLDEDDVCVLIWQKEAFDYEDDDEVTLTTEAWEEVCGEFDRWDNAGESVGEWIADAVAEKAVPNEPKSNVIQISDYRLF